jgi:hypothetical protein
MCRPARDQAGQVVAVVDPAGVDRGPAVTQQQRPRVAVGDRLPLALLVADAAVRVEAHVAVRVDQPRHDPPLGDELGAALGLVGHQPVHDVQVTPLGVGEARVR